jgi:hypothetical protein
VVADGGRHGVVPAFARWVVLSDDVIFSATSGLPAKKCAIFVDGCIAQNSNYEKSSFKISV